MMTRRAVAHSLPSFGRRTRPFVADEAHSRSSELAGDLRLFALTFAGGFLFLSTYLA